MDGAFELIAVGEVDAAATGDLVQTAQLLPAATAIGDELEQSANGEEPSGE
jgi:hypothetical protein